MRERAHVDLMVEVDLFGEIVELATLMAIEPLDHDQNIDVGLGVVVAA